MKRIAFATAAVLLSAGAGQAADMRICVEGAYPPFSEVGPSGEIKGFDIDIAKALCAEMGESCEMVQTEWDAIIPSLEEGKCDAIVASMSITEDRKQRVDFTDKYYQTPAKFVAEEGVDWEDTNEGLAGKRVCVQRGTIHQDYMEGEYPDVDLGLYATQDEAYLDLVNGRCDAIMVDSVAASEGFVNTDMGEGFAFFGADHAVPEYHGEGAGIAIRKGDDELRKEFNAAIEAIREDGTYEKIADEYFDFDVYGGESS